MSDPATHEVTRLLADWAKGNEQALDDLTPLALVHEAYLRLVDQTSPSLQNRSHFYGVAARLMRQIPGGPRAPETSW